ncbi:MAG: pyridoxal phosphate-dependent aminotransferase [Breznakibacter sp.]
MRVPLPISPKIVDDALKAHEIDNIGHATIREVSAVVADIEAVTGMEFIHMEIGIPSLAPPPVGVQAEIEALQNGVAAQYPQLNGISTLKHEASRFLSAFANVHIDPQGCIATVGSMQGSFAAFLLAGQLDPKKNTILFLDPGFPVHKQQAAVMGYQIASFDVYEHRHVDFGQQLERYFSQGNIAAVIYSNPNNPTWICFHEDELETIGRLAQQYDVIVVEDLAYFGMDFRTDSGHPFQPPYQPSVARYCNNCIILVSSSKAFSYAGQRVALMCVSDELYHRHYPALARRYGIGEFGNVLVQRIIYTLSSGASHSAQHALAAMLKAANDGTFHFLDELHEYGNRAHDMKRILTENGFGITYPNDIDTPIADGFYFTFHYDGLAAAQLQKELLRYGISAISLYSAGCRREALRACVSQVKQNQFDELTRRLKLFCSNNPK